MEWQDVTAKRDKKVTYSNTSGLRFIMITTKELKGKVNGKKFTRKSILKVQKF